MVLGDQQSADLMEGYHRQAADEQEKQYGEQANGANVNGNVPNCGVEHVPRRRHIVPVQAGYYDDKPFKPHAYIDKLADKEKPEHIRAEISDPEQLWDDDIT